MSVKIIIEFTSEYAHEEAKNKLDAVHQLFMCRDPLSEPFISIETKNTNAEKPDDIQLIATRECGLLNGSDWKLMYSGDQDAQIDAWIDGYQYAINNCNSPA